MVCSSLCHTLQGVTALDGVETDSGACSELLSAAKLEP